MDGYSFGILLAEESSKRIRLRQCQISQRAFAGIESVPYGELEY